MARRDEKKGSRLSQLERQTAKLLQEARNSLRRSRGRKRKAKAEEHVGEEVGDAGDQADKEEEVEVEATAREAHSGETKEKKRKKRKRRLGKRKTEEVEVSEEGEEDDHKQEGNEEDKTNGGVTFSAIIARETRAEPEEMLQLDDDFWPSKQKGKRRRRVRRREQEKLPPPPQQDQQQSEQSEQSEQDEEEGLENETDKVDESMREQVYQAESKVRDLPFEAELARVAEQVDDFVPGISVSKEELEKQKERVQRLEDEQQRRVREAEELERHKALMEQERREKKAAIIIQSTARGRQGRKRALNVKQAGGIQNYSTVPQRHAWKQVHDPATGDTWYYNTETGHSQWELPEELGRQRLTSDEHSVRIGRNHSASLSASSSKPETPLRFPPLSRQGVVTWSDSDSLVSTPFSERGQLYTRGTLQSASSVATLDQLPPITPGSPIRTMPHRHSNNSEDLDYLGMEQVSESQRAEDSASDLEEEFEEEFQQADESDCDPREEMEDGVLDVFDCIDFSAHATKQDSNPQTNDREDDTMSERDSVRGSETSSVATWGEACETPRFFLPDGTTDVKLRETVRNALKQTKYDSVSALLAGMAQDAAKQRRAQRKERKSAKTRNQPPGHSAKTAEKAALEYATIEKARPNFVSAAALRKKKGGLRKKRGDDECKTEQDEEYRYGRSIADEHHEEMEMLLNHPPQIRDITYAGTELDDLQTAQEKEILSPTHARVPNAVDKDGKEICFLCWCAGNDVVQRCNHHPKGEDHHAGDNPKNSVLTCANWTIDALMRKYRAEEIQEVFAKSNSSLRWDINRKRFVTIVQAKHPIYRETFELLDSFNRKARGRIRVMNWFRSVLDQMKLGRVRGDQAARKSGILKAKEAMANNRYIRKFKETVSLLQPQPPQTQDDILLAGKLNVEEGYKVVHRDENAPGAKKRVRLVVAPTAKPLLLYAPRDVKALPDPWFGRVPPPSFAFVPEVDELQAAKARDGSSKESETLHLITQKASGANRFMDVHFPGSWIERVASHTAKSATEMAVKEIRDQIPQVVQYRTKHPPPTTTKYATFLRRPLEEGKPKKLVVPPPMMVALSEEVTTAVSAQFGKFVVATKASVAPVKTRYESFQNEDDGVVDDSMTFRSLRAPFPESMGCSYDPLVSALNSRLPPTIVASATVHEILSDERKTQRNTAQAELDRRLKMEEITLKDYRSLTKRLDEDESTVPLDDYPSRHYHGENRQSQTGETQDTGFRTTAACPAAKVEREFETVEFTPSGEVAMPNNPGIVGAVTTRAGIDYPFCIPSTRELSLLDHFHLLVFAQAVGNPACCFTALGRQDPGEYLWKNVVSVPLGILEMRLYRSFAYFQTTTIEEYSTAEGVTYWYDAKTGHTFWEPPLVDLSKVEDDEDRELVEDPLKPITKHERKKHSTTLGAKRKPPSELRMRQHMLTDYDEDAPDEAEKEKQLARAMSKADTKRKAQEKRFRDRVGQTNILKGTQPLQDVQEEQEQKEQVSILPDDNKESQADVSQQQNQNKPMQPLSKSTSKQDQPQQQSQVSEDEVDGDDHHAELISSIQSALQSVMKDGNVGGGITQTDLLKLGVGLGLGLGMRKKTTQASGDVEQQRSSIPTPVAGRTSSTIASDEDESETGEVLVVRTPRHTGPFTKKERKRSIEPTPTPDEEAMAQSRADGKTAEDVEEASVENNNDTVTHKFHSTHQPAGEGTSWNARGTAKARLGGKVFRSRADIPEGFVDSLYKPHTAKQHADYLPKQPNLNEARSVGVVKPRNILKDWTLTKFDPWSDGKDQFSTSFVPSLFVDEVTGEHVVLANNMDKDGIQAQRAEIVEQNKQAEELERLFSFARHGRYDEVERILDDPDTVLSGIDQKDALGNTLLIVAAQNGNKRITKLCLRRGADINAQNLSGNTALHYCMSYSFDALAEYLMKKGADDSILNSDGLTAYEGLSLENLESL